MTRVAAQGSSNQGLVDEVVHEVIRCVLLGLTCPACFGFRGLGFRVSGLGFRV